jgi:enoyl-CoA hydratase/carnithine racemase
MSAQILLSHADGVLEIRLNRPEKRNAITFAMYEALCGALERAQADEAVRVVMFSAAGAGFCAGNDLQDFLTGPDFDLQHPVLRLLRALVSFPKPLVAAVHGQAVGIGATMLLHFDLVIAASGARFSMPFVSLGLVPEAGSSLLLPRLIGPQRAAQMLLLGSVYDAAAALGCGLINRLVDEGALAEETRAVAVALSRQPQQALAATRRLLRGDPTEVLARIEEEARIFAAQLKSPEFQARVRAALEKAKPGSGSGTR